MANRNSIVTVVVDVASRGLQWELTPNAEKADWERRYIFCQFCADVLYGNENSKMLMLAVDHFTKFKIPSLQLIPHCLCEQVSRRVGQKCTIFVVF